MLIILICLLMSTLTTPSAAVDVEVTGSVFSLDHAPVAGVNVLLKGTSEGSVTNAYGRFKLDIPEGESVLVFSFLGKKTWEQTIVVRQGFQYQINVTIASRAQTFNKSSSISAELPADSPVVMGRVFDQDRIPLTGVNVTQRNSEFRTITDAEGNFSLPVSEGNNAILFDHRGSKQLNHSLDLDRGTVRELEVILVQDRGRYRSWNSRASTLDAHGATEK